MLQARRLPTTLLPNQVLSTTRHARWNATGILWSHHHATYAPSQYAAVVAGAGPAGLAVVGNLLENRVPGKVLWVDPTFEAGLLGKEWREVPSNTKVDLFLAFAEAVKPFKDIIETSLAPNAVTALRDLPQDRGCPLSNAADMVDMLTAGLQRHPQVDVLKGTLSGANWEDSSTTWIVESQSEASCSSLIQTISTDRLVLCTGSHPNEAPIPISGLRIRSLDLYHALKPSVLQGSIPAHSDAAVAVIGSSHSAILCLLNLYNLARSSHPRLRIKWFTRTALQYAVPQDGWILRDNTGLKGIAAEFARESLEDNRLSKSEAGKYITRYDCNPEIEKRLYRTELTDCHFIIRATGFSLNDLPKLSRNGKPILRHNFNSETGALLDESHVPIPRTYGAGIAFPERVVDPQGNVEYAVGLWKFMKYLKRVSKQWTMP